MAKRKETNKPARHCGECIKLIWNTVFCNLDANGLPIHGRCLVTEQNRIRTDESCEDFKEQTDDSQNYYKLSRQKWEF